MTRAPTAPLRLGLRANLAQFTLLVAVNALVGAMIGQERSILPLLADQVFGLTAVTASLTFIVAFGLTKAATNVAAGSLSDRYGRKPVLVAGWLIGLPVPLLLIWAPGWGWVIVANVLLGINQGLTSSTTIVMKIDLVDPERRGLAMGLNEAAGYTAVAATALGLGLSTVFVRETHHHVRLEAASHSRAGGDLSGRHILIRTSFTEKALSSASQAGMVNNLNDGLAWGLYPILFATSGLGLARIGALAAIYPAVWGLGQTVTGALSDRWGRKWLIVGGMLSQAVGIAIVAAGSGFAIWAVAAILMGAGTAMVSAEVPDMALTRALSRRARPIGQTAAAKELAAIVVDLYRRLARNRTAIKLVDRCAPELPELAEVWLNTGRGAQMSGMEAYLSRRQAAGDLVLPGPVPLVARTVVELCVLWAVHCRFDPALQATIASPVTATDDEEVAATLATLLARGLTSTQHSTV